MLALLGVSLASAKTYTFTVPEPSHAGQVQLKPGDYNLKVDGSQAVLMDGAGHRIDATVKIETADRKFDATTIYRSKADGTDRIRYIELGGTRNKAVFE
jgi:hypothetical protein